MFINNDMWDVIADVEILGYIKSYDWPTWPGPSLIFSTPLITREKSPFDDRMVVDDVRYGNPKFALWIAMHCPEIDPHEYVNILNLPVLYNNGFITNFDRFQIMIYAALSGEKISIDALAIIISCKPELYEMVFDYAIERNRLEVIEWLYATYPSARSVSHSALIYKCASDAVMDLYDSKCSDWLSGAYNTIMSNISNPVFVYNEAFSWLMDKTGFDMLPYICANNGELIERMIRRADYLSSRYVPEYLTGKFSDVIHSLSPERLESIVTILYVEYEEDQFAVFMDNIAVAKLPVNIVMNTAHSQVLLQKIYNRGNISGDFESIKAHLFAEYEDDSWYDQF